MRLPSPPGVRTDPSASAPDPSAAAVAPNSRYARLAGDERAWMTIWVAALLALRLPFFPPTFEDIDSVNFDLGVHDYSPPAHRPHPPGYPVYTLLGLAGHWVTDSHATALAVVSSMTGALLLVPLHRLLRQLLGARAAAAGAALTLFNPLVWFNGVRPMSDTAGLMIAVLSQCLLVLAADRLHAPTPAGRRLAAAGAFAAGLSAGVRLQAIVLTGPVLLFLLARRPRARGLVAAAAAAGATSWLVPLMMLSGGPGPFLQSTYLMMREAARAEPLLSRWSAAAALEALRHMLVAPWVEPAFAGTVLALAALGLLILLRSAPTAAAWLLLLYLPYGVYHFLLQDTRTYRYGLPVVPLVAALAGAALAGWRSKVATGLAVSGAVAASAVVTIPALMSYHGTPSPPFQALAKALESPPRDQVVSGHYLFYRYLPYAGPLELVVPRPGLTLLALGEYWRAGGQKPIAFLNDPSRRTLRFTAPESQARIGRWRWTRELEPFLLGARPGDVELVRLDPPAWFAESELPLIAGSPEPGLAAGRLPVVDALRIHFRQGSGRMSLAVAGSVLDAPGATENAGVEIHVASRPWERRSFSGSFVLATVVETGRAPDIGYVPVTVRTDRPVQFTELTVLPETAQGVHFGRGFYGAERDEDGRPFRWMAREASAAVHVPARCSLLRVAGEIPLDYFKRRVSLTIRWNGTTVATVQPETYLFAVERPIAPEDVDAWGHLTLEASDSFVPSAIEGGGDGRELSFRITDVSLR